MRMLAGFALLLTSSAGLAATPTAPWALPMKAVAVQRELSFTSGTAKLSGTLYRPAGNAKVPVVIVLHGAQAPSRDEHLYDHLKAMLPPLGMAVFVYDRRGTGKSSAGDRNVHDFDVLADDGIAAFHMLAAETGIDAARIGFWGLSQGGWLTLLAAAKEPKAAFAISISAPMATADVQMNFAVANIMRIKGYPQTDIDEAVAARTAVDDYARGKRDRASAEAADKAAQAKPWYKLIYLKGNIDDPAWPQQIGSDPLVSLDRSRVPTLMIYGQADPWVPVGPSIAAIERTAARHPNVTMRVVAGADHSMMLGVDPAHQIDPAFFPDAAPDAPEYFGLMTSWLTARKIATPPVR